MVCEARLIRSFPLENCGGKLALFDINGDGKLEFLFRQSAGHLRSQATREKGETGNIPEDELRLNCITAFDFTGKRLWQIGQPFQGDYPFISHGGDDLAVAEIDADGIVEVINVETDRLRVYSGLTGELKKERPLPADNFCVVRCGAMRGDRSRQEILVKVTATAYPPYHYGNPTLLLDGDLNEIWKQDHFHGSGHVPVFIDIDGDGHDELLIGYNLVDHDGRLLWTIPVENANADHADQILARDFNGDGRIEIAFAGSKDYFVADAQGKILWARPHEHAQKTVSGRLRGDLAGETIILNEKWIGMTAYTPDGEELWRIPGVGYAQRAVRGWRDDGLDYMLYEPQWKVDTKDVPYYSEPERSLSLWPYLINGEGERALDLPWSDDFIQPRQLVRGFRSYDFGIGYSAKSADIDGDGIDEVIISDRNRVWIFGPPGKA